MGGKLLQKFVAILEELLENKRFVACFRAFLQHVFLSATIIPYRHGGPGMCRLVEHGPPVIHAGAFMAGVGSRSRRQSSRQYNGPAALMDYIF
jgi:hypothetical protein